MRVRVALWLLLASACATPDDLDAPGGGVAAAGAGPSGAGGEGGKAGGGGDAGDASAGDGGTGACIPGAQVACDCPDGAEGVQICNPQGDGYEPCQCPDAGSAGAAAGGAGGAGAGGAPAAAGGSGGASAAGGGAGSGGTGATSGSSGTAGGAGVAGTGGSGTGGTSGGAGTSGSGGSAGTGGAGGDPDACPGASVSIGPGITTIDGSTSGETNDYVPPGCTPSGSGNDVVYAVTPQQSGSLTAKVTPQGFSTCLCRITPSCTPNFANNCVVSLTIGNSVTTTFPVTAGTTYYLVIDSYTVAVTGSYTLELTLLP
jgi:hypothetical protein